MSTFTIDENAPILIDFTSPPAQRRGDQPGLRRASLSPADLAAQSTKALDSAMNAIHHMARRVIATIDALSDRPSQVEVAFGLTLDSEAGALIAKAGMEASINVTLTWEREKTGQAPD